MSSYKEARVNLTNTQLSKLGSLEKKIDITFRTTKRKFQDNLLLTRR